MYFPAFGFQEENTNETNPRKISPSVVLGKKQLAKQANKTKQKTNWNKIQQAASTSLIYLNTSLVEYSSFLYLFNMAALNTTFIVEVFKDATFVNADERERFFFL